MLVTPPIQKQQSDHEVLQQEFPEASLMNKNIAQTLEFPSCNNSMINMKPLHNKGGSGDNIRESNPLDMSSKQSTEATTVKTSMFDKTVVNPSLQNISSITSQQTFKKIRVKKDRSKTEANVQSLLVRIRDSHSKNPLEQLNGGSSSRQLPKEPSSGN